MDFEGLLHGKPLRPSGFGGQRVNILLVADGAVRHTQQHAAGGAAVQIDAVNRFQAATAGNAAVAGGDVGRVLRRQLNGQHRLQTARTGNK